jgi:hypothetical protein
MALAPSMKPLLAGKHVDEQLRLITDGEDAGRRGDG